jgi:transposase
VAFVDGRKKRIHFFASRLQYLRFVTISILENERVETLVQRLARHFVAFGGLPLLTVFDRSRTIVTKSGKGRAVEAFNATFAQAILDIGVGVEMSEARSGNQKGEERTRLQRDVKRLKRQREILKKTPAFFERASEACAYRRGLLQTSYPWVMADGM